MLKKHYSAVLNVNFDEFEDFEELNNFENNGISADHQISATSRLNILKKVYLNLLITLGPKVTSVFTNFKIVNEELMPKFYNELIDKMEKDYAENNNDDMIYDFFTVAKGEYTDINVGFTATGVYIATVSTRKCVEQDVVSNYIEKSFLTIFINETARDMIRYEVLFGLQSEDIKNLFTYATILSLKNDVYPISFSPLSRFVKNDENKELSEQKIRKIYKTLIENFGE